MDASRGLRDRKKHETRRRISDTATELFMARGFDTVTITEIAEAAGVAKMTVFNYFPRKEDLLFDRGLELTERITAAVRQRRTGESTLSALKRMMLDLLDEQHPAVTPAIRFRRFWEVVRESPALLGRVREMSDEQESLLAKLITETTNRPTHDPATQLTAALAVAAYRTAYRQAVQRILNREPEQQVTADFRTMIQRSFTLLDLAIPHDAELIRQTH